MTVERHSGPRILEAVAGALTSCPPNEGHTVAEVHARLVGAPLARTTVRHALRELVKSGDATFEGPDSRRRYRRATP